MRNIPINNIGMTIINGHVYRGDEHPDTIDHQPEVIYRAETQVSTEKQVSTRADCISTKDIPIDNSMESNL